MPNYTTNLNLEKPLASEQYNIDVFNANADKIDQFAGQTPARALTADKLTTGAKINGVNFKGDTDVVTGAGFYYETVTYGAGDLAFIYNQDGALELHKSLSAGNIGHNPLTSTGYWEKVELGGSGGRNVGEIIQSSLPLTDAGLHLLDGTRLSGDGIYKGFVDYIEKLYAESSKKSNVTKVGSLTDNNGVLSGFSLSNYAKLPNSVSLGNNFEICVKFTTGNDVTSEQKILRINVNYSFALGINSSGVPDFNIGDGTQWLNPSKTLQTLDANTTYWFKITFNGSRYSLLYSTDGNTFTEGGYLDNTAIVPSALLLVGVGQNANSPWLGSIDLNESYININGQRWWSGANPSWATDETQWQSSVSSYGVCGKFVYDSTNNTVRLPKVTGKIDGTTDINALGNLEPLFVRLPNITGSVGWRKVMTSGQSASGVFSYNGSNGVYTQGSEVSGQSAGFNFDASRSSSVYSGNGSDTAIHEQAIKCFVYIVIATSSKTEIQTDIDEVVTDLNGKADTDLTNVTDTGYIKMAGASMPSGRYVSLTLGANGATYTAPADGWVIVTGYNANSSITIWQGSTNMSNTAGNSGDYYTVMIPVRKGNFNVGYRGITLVSFKFIYAQGSESEAS